MEPSLRSKPEMTVVPISCLPASNGCRRATAFLSCGERVSTFSDWLWECCDGLAEASECLRYLSRDCGPHFDFRKREYSIYFPERRRNAYLRRRRRWNSVLLGERRTYPRRRR